MTERATRPDSLPQMHDALVQAWRKWREMGVALEKAQRAYDRIRLQEQEVDEEAGRPTSVE